VLAIPLTVPARARPWIVAAIVVGCVWGCISLAIHLGSARDRKLAHDLIVSELPAVGAGDSQRLLARFILVPDNTRSLEARIQSWRALGAFLRCDSIQELEWSWSSGRYYHIEGEYVSTARFQNGIADVYWTLVRAPDGALGIWDVSVGTEARRQ